MGEVGGSTSHCERLLVAAFDFGTTFSGYAFSFRDRPMDIKTNQSWVAGSQQLISMKTPTWVLLNPQKEFHSFGFEAENKYSELAEDDEHKGWYLFRRFKMVLYNTENLRMDTTIEDISGKKMQALTIFGHSIRYLNSHMLQRLNSQTDGVQPRDIQYVLTVPAIWDQKAKQFMRKAAIEAGIKDDQLKIALEPEAASIWCQVATDHILSGLAKEGSKYMVVDLGGGTVDITMHEKMKDGSLKEIHKASGGSWGGTQVDNAYLDMLSDVFGSNTMEKFKKTYLGDYFDLLRDFETKKRTVTKDTVGKMTFKIPSTLKDCSEANKVNIKALIEKSKYRGKMILSGDKIRIEKVVAVNLFSDVIGNITKHVGELLSYSYAKDLDTILLVGGFGECELVKDAFEKKFTKKKVMIPTEAGLAVLKGSVRFGHIPEIVSVRIAQLTYGTSIRKPFDKKVHDAARKITRDGKEYCGGVFSIMVKIGEEIPYGKEVQKEQRPDLADQETGHINVYSSTNPNPKYVTDNGCKLLGTIWFDYPNADNVDDKANIVCFTFGHTELYVKVVMKKTGESYETVIDCFK